ncbi:Importin subunit alpha-3 [Chlorella vulgaris]
MDGTRQLVAELRDPHFFTQLRAAESLRDLAHDPSKRQRMAAAKAVPALVEVLASANISPQVQAASAEALEGLMADTGQHQAIAAAIPALVRLLERSYGWGMHPAAAAAMLLSRLCCSNRTNQRAAADSIPALVQLLGRRSTTAAQKAAAQALAALAEGCFQNQQAVFGSEARAELLSLVQSGDPGVREAAGKALEVLPEFVFGADTPSTRRYSPHGAPPSPNDTASQVPRMVPQTQSPSPAGPSAHVEAEIDRQDIPALVRHLGSSSSAEVQKAAARALGTMAVYNPVSQQTIEDAGVIPALVRLLGSGNLVAVQKAAARALFWLAFREPGHQQRIADAGGIPELVRLLGSDIPPAVQEVAAQALESQGIAGAGGIRALEQLLVDSSCPEQLRLVVTSTLRQLHGPGPVANRRFVRPRSVPATTPFTFTAGQAPPFPQAQAPPPAGSVPGPQIVAEIGRLVQDMTTGSLSEKAAAARRVGDLARDACNHQAMADATATPALVRLLNSGVPRVQKAAAGAVRALGNGSPHMQQAVASEDAIHELVRLLGSDISPAVQAAAAYALESVAAGNPDTQQRIADAGGIRALVGLLGSNIPPAVQEVAAQEALESVAAGNLDTQQVAVGCLIELLDRDSPGVHHQAEATLELLLELNIPPAHPAPQ